MNFSGTTLGAALGAGDFEGLSLSALSEEDLMLIHGGDSASFAGMGPVGSFVADVAREIAVNIIADAIVGILSAEGTPQETQSADPSNGTEGRGSI
jgi:hypothetical protein